MSLINSRIQTLDIGQIVGDPGQAGQVLLSAGNGNATWNDAFDSDAAKTAIDSAYLSVIIDSAYVNLRTDATIDSAKIFNIIDSAYINFRVDDLWLDSADAIGLIDSAYINFRVDDIWLDSAEATALIDSAYITSRINNDLFIDSSEALPLINSRIQTLDIGQVVGSPGAVGQILQSTGNGNAQWIEAFDSAETIQLVDSAYVQARQVAPNYILFGLDSAVQNETDTEMRTMGSAATGWRMPVGGTVTNVTMQLEVTTNSASQTLTAELVKNGVKTGKTVAVDVSSTGFAGTDSAISETYVAGDRLTLYITTSDATMVTNEHNAIVRVLENL